LVFIELLRRTNYNPLIQIFYFKTADSEVDFLIKEGTAIKQLIQLPMQAAETRLKREK
jgi:hypothetical protein